MIRLHVVVEGPTERGFVNKVLAPHLAEREICADARCVRTSRDMGSGRKFSGGFSSYSQIRDDIWEWLKEDGGPDVRLTTMLDLYALPRSFPGRRDADLPQEPRARAAFLERRLGESIGDRRFLPHIQLHEFEALLLAEPERLRDHFLKQDRDIRPLLACAADPELVDEGPRTAPSKRIIGAIPEYAKAKASAGPDVAKAIGLDVLRTKCPHFGAWLSLLENLSSAPSGE